MVQAAWLQPFIEMEWGKKAYELNRRIKAIFDPERILNPDVIVLMIQMCIRKILKLNALSTMLSQSVWNGGFCENIVQAAI